MTIFFPGIFFPEQTLKKNKNDNIFPGDIFPGTNIKEKSK